MRIEIQDFGPIRGGAFTLKPLTVFIGPNNSGKSYAAMLAYVFANLEGWLPLLAATDQQAPASDRSPTEEMKRRVKQELRRCFGAGLSSLIRASAKGSRVKFTSTRELGEVVVKLHRDRENEVFVEGPSRPPTGAAYKNLVTETTPSRARKWRAGYEIPSCHYLPASRSAFLQGRNAFAAGIVRDWPLVYLRAVEIQGLTGTVADFIGELLQLEEKENLRLVPEVASYLESQLCDGTVAVERPGDGEYAQVFYARPELKIPIHRTSSMVSEVAPIILYLKHVVSKGDTLIIEEPEAHLHPAGQLIMVRAIARLVNTGVRALITTHSDYLLHELSNLVKLSAAAEAAESLGWAPEEVLRPDQVAVYLFSFEKDASGSSVKELEVTAQEGIPQEEFGRVAEALYQKSTRLEYVRLHSE